MKSKKQSNRESARTLGEQKAKEYGFNSFPIDPIIIAEKCNIQVRANPSKTFGVSGVLIRNDLEFGILYSEFINNPGFQRFSIAHELGHYFLDGHPEKIFQEGSIHQSHAGFTSNDECELEADSFASGLLMPGFILKDAIGKYRDGLEGIKALSELCQTSLTATAIRYIEYTDCPAAMIISSGGTVEYCFMSESLKEWNRDLIWVAKGTTLPSISLTSSFNKDSTNIELVKSENESTDVIDWFGGSISAEGKEEVIGLGSYGKTLTVLSFPNLPDEEELEEEERFTDSWTPKLR